MCACEGQTGRFGEEIILNMLSFSGPPDKSMETQMWYHLRRDFVKKIHHGKMGCPKE